MAAALAGLLCAGPGASRAAVIGTIGGTDAISMYQCPVSGDCYGTLSFDDGTPGVVTSQSSISASLINAVVHFEVTLDDERNNSATLFDPATTSILRAQFRGAPNGDLLIEDVNGNVLLAFDVVYVDVSTAVTPFPPADVDGQFSIGQQDEAAYATVGGSRLHLMGGTLNQLAGGIGTAAVFQMLFSTLNPALTNLKGYFGNDFTAGGTGGGQFASTWNLTLISTPEPATALLVGVGLLGLIAGARRSSRRE
jgi:hypothetical protein